MNKKWHLSALAAACILLASPSYAAKDANTGLNALQLTGIPTLEFKDGNVSAKVVGSAKSKFSYLDGALTLSEAPNGTKGEYFYQRDGRLDRIVFTNGVVHTPRFDAQGNLYALVSTSGKALQIVGNVRTGRKLFVMQENKIVVPTPLSTASTSTPDSLVNLLIEATGWEQIAPKDDSNSTNGECIIKPEDLPQGGGKDNSNSSIALRSSESTKLQSKSADSPVTTGCAVVVITGPGGGGDSGGGGGGGGGGPDLPTQYPPGVAGSDTPSQAVCMERGYRAWTQMTEFCGREPSPRDQAQCREVAMRLYVEEIAYCKTL